MNSEQLAAEAVRATNAAIAAGELIEENHKTVNEVYLSTIAKDIDSFTAAQAEALFAVANQCPFTGGNAVFRARAIYSLIDDVQDFDDPMLCLQEGMITKRSPEVEPRACTMIPNPAHDQATLVLPVPLAEQAWLVLTNALGAEVLRSVVPVQTLRWSMNTELLAPAMYQYQVRGPSGLLGFGKLTIVR